MSMSEKRNFCLTFDWPLGIKESWIALTSVWKMDEDRRAVITLDASGYVDHYRRFVVEISSKTSGLIHKQAFEFSDFLDLNQRADNRSDYPGPYEVNANIGWQWYIAVPKDTKPLVEAILQYIDSWR